LQVQVYDQRHKRRIAGESFVTKELAVPIYEYACQSCDAKFEKLVRTMGHNEPAECPECGSKKTARTLSVFAALGEGKKGEQEIPPMCGRCGGPGPCAME